MYITDFFFEVITIRKFDSIERISFIFPIILVKDEK